MKLIQAIIRPERLEAVQQALREVLDEQEHYRMTVQTVEGHGRQEGRVEIVLDRHARVWSRSCRSPSASTMATWSVPCRRS